MKVIFSHGKESGPWGSKIKALAHVAKSLGFDVDSIDYTDTYDPELRVSRLSQRLDEEHDDIILVGSSMGGYVSALMANREQVKGTFLLAPALFIPSYAQQSYPEASPIAVIHGWSDDVIPYQHSVKYAAQQKCALHLIDGDHRLNTSIEQVVEIFRQFLCSVK